MNCIIVDDEESARIELRTMLNDYAAISIAGEAASVREALNVMRRTNDVDLLLLDIELPDGTGFELLEQLSESPRVIFITNYESYALRAFEINALDYIRKPLTRSRLAMALERLNSNVVGLKDDAALNMNDLILLHYNQSRFFVRMRDILAIESEQNYTHVIRSEGKPIMIKKTLQAWSEQLPRDEFKTIGRSRIVNVSRVDALHREDDQWLLTFRNSCVALNIKKAEAKRIEKMKRSIR